LNVSQVGTFSIQLSNNLGAPSKRGKLEDSRTNLYLENVANSKGNQGMKFWMKFGWTYVETIRFDLKLH